MRQDLCRTAEVKDVFARSICGHATEAMQRRYSSVGQDEQQEGLARVIRLMDRKGSTAPTTEGGRVGGRAPDEGGREAD